MSQRNPMNERYQSDEKLGKTRKSASAAKPVTRAASTTSAPAPKTKKQKRAEARAREEKEMQKAREMGVDSNNMPTTQYHTLRRQYWICLIGAIIATAVSFLFSTMESPWSDYSMGCLILAYILIIGALYIDMAKLRKIRKGYNAQVMHGKSKADRKLQKERAAKAREQKKEAEEAYAAAKEAGATQESKSFGDRVKGWFSTDKAKKAKEDLQDKAEQVKESEAQNKKNADAAE